MKQYVIAILLSAALGLSASCSRTSDLPASQTQEDLTLKPAEYMDLGFPATDRPWTTADYQAAYHAMRTLPVAQFPRSTSPKSSPVVDRLANPDNLGLFLNKSLPLDQRFLPCIDLVDSANAISKLYLAAHAKTPLFAADFIRMEGFMLHAVTVELSLIEEFLPTLDKKDPRYPTRMAGLATMKSGMAQVIQGILIVLEDRKTYTTRSRAELASTISSTFPVITPHLPPLSRKEFAATLRRIANEETDVSVKTPLMNVMGTE
jgi:hypothetical protein